MTYSTVEAYVKDKEIIFWDDFIAPKKTMKVLVTFFEEQDINETDYWLYEANKADITDEMLDLSKKVLKKDKKLFTNI